MMAKDGQTLFYVDKINEQDKGFSLYYRNVNELNKEAIKVDSDMISYHVDEKLNFITYLKGNDNILYQYDIKKDEKKKMDEGVRSFYVSDDGNKILYLNQDNDIYLRYSNEDKEKIDSGVLSYISKDFTTVYYMKEGSLYKKEAGKDKIKISSDVYGVLKAYDSGTVYYLKENAAEASLMDYVQDDMKEYDATLTMPEMPKSPLRWQFLDSDEYEAACKEYKAAYDAYREALGHYQSKEKRDEIRERLSSATLTPTTYTLCYFNGREEQKITETFVDYSNHCSNSSDSSVIAFSAYNQSDLEKRLSKKINISQIKDYSTARQEIEERLGYLSSEQYIAVGSKFMAMEQNNVEKFYFGSAGKSACFTTEEHELYKISLSDGKAELYDTDVESDVHFFSNDKLVYYKNCNSGTGDLYINKEQIDRDVEIDSVRYHEDYEAVVYYTDWNSSKESGTLKVYENGNVTKIANDVHSYEMLPDGRILYLYDFSTKYYKGDLYLYKNGEAEKIDFDVVGIIRDLDGKYRGGRYDDVF